MASRPKARDKGQSAKPPATKKKHIVGPPLPELRQRFGNDPVNRFFKLVQNREVDIRDIRCAE